MRVDAIEFQVSQETRKFRLKLMDQRPGIGRSELRNQVTQFEETYRAGLFRRAGLEVPVPVQTSEDSDPVGGHEHERW